MKEEIEKNEALEMMKLGFDEPCFAHFVKHYDEIKCILNSDDFDEWWTNNSDNLEVKAPLYQQAFRWFREKHNLHSEILLDMTSYPKYCFEIHKYEDFGNYDKVTINDWYLYVSYEDAEYACLKKLIKF